LGTTVGNTVSEKAAVKFHLSSLVSMCVGLQAGCSSVQTCDRPGDPGCMGPIRVMQYEQMPVASIGKLQAAVALANETLCSPGFAAAAQGVTHWDHGSDNRQALPCDAGHKIVEHLLEPRCVVIRGWDPDEHWWITNRVEAFTDDGVIYVNTKRLSVLTTTQWAHVIAHESAHVAGYAHAGNKCRGNEKTVPYQVGRLVQEVAEHHHEEDPALARAN
jgi:hypothetical protein